MFLAALGIVFWLTEWSGCYGVSLTLLSEELGVEALELELSAVKLDGLEVK